MTRDISSGREEEVEVVAVAVVSTSLMVINEESFSPSTSSRTSGMVAAAAAAASHSIRPRSPSFDRSDHAFVRNKSQRNAFLLPSLLFINYRARISMIVWVL
jgi:hypothetical protein